MICLHPKFVSLHSFGMKCVMTWDQGGQLLHKLERKNTETRRDTSVLQQEHIEFNRMPRRAMNDTGTK